MTSITIELPDDLAARAQRAGVLRNPSVDALIEEATCPVPGDQDLLVLQAFEGIQIVTAAQALARLRVQDFLGSNNACEVIRRPSGIRTQRQFTGACHAPQSHRSIPSVASAF